MQKKKECLIVKNDNLIYYDFINSIETIGERDQIASEIDYLLESIFENSNDPLTNALKKISVQTEEKLKGIFKKNNLDILDRETVKNDLSQLKKILKSFKVIKLSIAFYPSREIIEKVSKWIKSNLGAEYLLDIEVNKSIIGGAIIVFNGKYRDMTLRKTLEETFANKNKEILSPAH